MTKLQATLIADEFLDLWETAHTDKRPSEDAYTKLSHEFARRSGYNVSMGEAGQAAGRTASEVSASGMPRKVPGTLSRNVCATSVANIAEAMNTGSNQASSSAWSDRRRPATVFAWIPGTRPLTAPQPIPTAAPSRILMSTQNIGQSGWG